MGRPDFRPAHSIQRRIQMTSNNAIEIRVTNLIAQMSLAEKIGQMTQMIGAMKR